LKLAELPNSIELEPLLGGCIRGRWLPPIEARSAAAALTGTKVEYGAMSSEAWVASPFRNSTATDERLEFEMPHLSPSSRYALRGRPVGFVAIERQGLHVKAGTVDVLEIALRPGGRARGRVQD